MTTMYSITNGTSLFTFTIAPILFGHPQKNIGRYRDCFLRVEERPQYTNHIFIYTRLGGGNREDYQQEIAKLTSHTHYVEDYDDSFDETYATFVFKYPKEFKEDIDLVMKEELNKTSEKYKKLILDTFPEIKDKLEEVLYSNK